MYRKSFFTISVSLFLMVSSFMLNAQVPGNGLVFDGDDDYVNIPTTTSDELNPIESFTLECWVNLNEVPSSSHFPHLISRFNCYSLTIGTNGLATAFILTDEGTWYSKAGTTIITTNKWYHLAATYDGSSLRIYVNGKLEGTIAASDTLARTTNNFRIGSRNAYVTNTNTNGIIDEARVWDIPRTEAEIQNSMNRTIPGNTPGLVGYWRFDDGSGTSAVCETPYHNNGTLMHMSLPSAWITSTASIGETSIFAESANITETSGTPVDVVFGAGPEGPGSGRSMAIMWVNQLPNSSSGLYPDRASEYWEIWSEDPDFDGDFTADVRFHYDNISGLPTESSIELFRRDDANGTWTEATGYTVVTDDGGSSTGTDGIGYVELTVTESTPGGFSGQYILSWSDAPPVVSDIPNQSVAEGSAFASIDLDDYVADPDNADSQITWTVSGETDVTVTITDRVATITANNPEWNGSNVVTLTAEDPEGETDSDQVTFEVTWVNDPPVVGDIPDQEIAEGDSFATIALDDFVTDADNDITTLMWTATGQTDLVVDITDRIATITVTDPEWNGSETITFQAEDPDGETGSDQAIFTLTWVNDPPVIDVIPNQTIAEGGSFTPIDLNDYVTDADDADSMLTWTTADEVNVAIDITDGIATITVNDPEWNGNERVRFTVEDTSGLQDFVDVRFIVTPVNDAPVVAGIPDQTMAEGQSFSQINLDDFVADADHPDDSLGWTAIGQSDITVSIVDRVATLTVDPEWNGSETIIFTATDPLGASDMDTCILTVTGINDAPTLEKAIPDTVAVAETAFTYVLDLNTFADIDPGDVLVLSASMSMGGSTPAWITFDPATGTFSGTPADGDKGLVEVIVTATDNSSAGVSDTFNIDVESYVGINNPLDGVEINLYPNPNHGRFVIESDRLEGKDVVLEIFNERGQLIWNREIRDQIGTLRESVDLDNAADGLYILRVRNQSGRINKRFVISY
jgi:hypothetical protein